MTRQLWMLAALAAMACSTANAALVNRYSFDTDGTDSVGGQNGTLFGNNGSFTGGQLSLDNTGEGSDNPGADGAWMNLPNGLVSSAASNGTPGAVTVEMWITMNENRNWAAAFSAGKSNGGEDTSSGGNGDEPYIQIIPRTGDGGAGNDFRVTSNSDGAGEGWVEDPGDGTDLQIGVEEHIVAIFDQTGSLPGTLTVYRNGVLVDGPQAISANLDLTTFAGGSDAAGDPNDGDNDYNVYIGRSQWPDSLVDASINEIRIWSNLLDGNGAAANYAAGPNTLGVPEPASCALALSALLGVAALRRRR